MFKKKLFTKVSAIALSLCLCMSNASTLCAMENVDVASNTDAVVIEEDNSLDNTEVATEEVIVDETTIETSESGIIIDQVEEINEESGEITDEASLIAAANAEHNEVVSYMVHQQSYGDSALVNNGAVAGTVNSGKRLESITITRTSASTSDVSGNIKYQAHCQSVGWTDWVTDGVSAGTTGKSKRLEAIRIDLTGDLKNTYDIYYKVYMSNCGWMDWAKNGEIAGTVGYASVIEGVQILLVVKESENAPVQGMVASITQDNMNDIYYSGHVQTYGNLDAVSNGTSLGTTGQSKRLEAIKIRLSHDENDIYGTVNYKVHIQSYGWRDQVNEGTLAGTTGESKRLEAISISLSGNIAEYCDIYYRVHAQTFGWLGWAKNGQNAGSAGYSKRLEAIQIKILPKGSAAPGKTTGCYYDSNDESTDYGYALLEPYLDNIIAKCTTSSMTKEQKLRALYDYVRTHYYYKTIVFNCPSYFEYHEFYAYETARNGWGNCYGFNFLFGHLAKKIGYTDVKFIRGALGPYRSPHGWVEIDGYIYDPEMAYKDNVFNFFKYTNFNGYSYYY